MPSFASACKHHLTVKMALSTLFPDQTTRTIPFLNHHQRNTRSTCSLSPITPWRIRNALAEQVWCVKNRWRDDVRAWLLGENNIKLNIVQRNNGNYNYRDDEREDRLMVNELLTTLRYILGHQRPQHPDEDEEVPMDHVRCKAQNLPELTIDVSTRHWQKIIFWLSNIMSLMCESFSIRVDSWAPLLATLSSSPPLFYVPRDQDLKTYVSLLDWKMLCMEQRRSVCKFCIYDEFRCVYDNNANLSSMLNLLVSISIETTTKLLRWYRQRILDCVNDNRCAKHANATNDYADFSWASNFVITLNIDSAFGLWRPNETYTSLKNRGYNNCEYGMDHHVDTMVSFLKKIVNRVSCYSDIRITMTDRSLQCYHFWKTLPRIFALMGDPLLRISYNDDMVGVWLDRLYNGDSSDSSEYST